MMVLEIPHYTWERNSRRKEMVKSSVRMSVFYTKEEDKREDTQAAVLSFYIITSSYRHIALSARLCLLCHRWPPTRKFLLVMELLLKKEHSILFDSLWKSANTLRDLSISATWFQNSDFSIITSATVLLSGLHTVPPIQFAGQFVFFLHVFQFNPICGPVQLDLDPASKSICKIPIELHWVT